MGNHRSLEAEPLRSGPRCRKSIASPCRPAIEGSGTIIYCFETPNADPLLYALIGRLNQATAAKPIAVVPSPRLW
jgi:hypothetical protein